MANHTMFEVGDDGRRKSSGSRPLWITPEEWARSSHSARKAYAEAERKVKRDFKALEEDQERLEEGRQGRCPCEGRKSAHEEMAVSQNLLVLGNDCVTLPFNSPFNRY